MDSKPAASSMDRRSFLRAVGLSGLGLALARPRLAMAAAGAPRPNIVVFLADDMGWAQVGYNGGTEVPTPSIDRIANEGTKLTQFYVQPVCSPTRACLLTGRYAWKNGMEVRPTVSSQHGMLRDEHTLAETLRDAGYQTWMVGKWHLGEWHKHHLPCQRGFDHHYGHYSALIDSFTHTRMGILDWHRNGTPVLEEGYSTFLFAQEAERLIAKHDGKKPFLLYLPFNAVHGPHQAPQEYVERYAEKGAKRAAQRAQLECMDIAIGRVLKAIQDKGVDGNTLVIFLNDNGGPGSAGANGPYRGGKSAYHEGGVRVPCCMRWPGHIQPGSASDEMLHVIDLYPTLAKLAGTNAEQKLPVDGLDAWTTITAGAPSPREEIVHSLQVIRRGDWKLIEEGASYYQWRDQPLQLYDIRHDPSETKNLAAERPEIVERLRARLAHHRQFAREGEKPSRIPGYPPVVYSADENREHGERIRAQVQALKARDVTARPRRRKRRKR